MCVSFCWVIVVVVVVVLFLQSRSILVNFIKYSTKRQLTILNAFHALHKISLSGNVFFYSRKWIIYAVTKRESMLISLKLVQRTKLFQLKMKCNRYCLPAQSELSDYNQSVQTILSTRQKKTTRICLRTIDVGPRGLCPGFSKLFQINERGDLKVCICG